MILLKPMWELVITLFQTALKVTMLIKMKWYKKQAQREL